MVRPPTARSVSATWDAVDSAGVAAHEIQVERVVAFVDAGGVRSQGDLLVGRNQAHHQLLAQPARGLGADLIGEATGRDVISQPAGCRASPRVGHCVAAAMSASCTASSQPPKSR